jgi:hypothetical protein
MSAASLLPSMPANLQAAQKEDIVARTLDQPFDATGEEASV